jgi:hypothetical protein
LRRILLAILLFVPGLALSDCDTAAVLLQIRPGAQWVLSGSDYAGLNWLDSVQAKPTPSEIQAGIDACNFADTPAQINLKQRSDAIDDLLLGQDDRAKETRAVLLTVFDENNNLRQWIQAFKGQVALASSLADLKTRVAALPDMPDRTVPQAKVSVQNKINSGMAD